MNGLDDAVAGSVLCWLATVGAEGRPNLSPKEIFGRAEDGRFVIADVASGRSVGNIRANSAVCVSLVDIFRQQGMKLEGTADIVGPEDDGFEMLSADLRGIAGEGFTIRHVIAVTIERMTPIEALLQTADGG